MINKNKNRVNHVKVLFLSLLSSISFGQYVFNGYDPALVYDMIFFKGEYIGFHVESNCNGGYLSSALTPELLTSNHKKSMDGYILKGKLDHDEEKWYALSYGYVADDIIDEQVFVYFQDSIHKIQKVCLKDKSTFIDFSTYKDQQLLVIDGSTKKLQVYGLNGKWIKDLIPNFLLDQVDYHGEFIYGIKGDSIIKCSDNTITAVTKVEEPIISYKWFDNALYVLHERTITIYDEDLNMFDEIEFLSNVQIIDFIVFNSELFVLSKMDDKYHVINSDQNIQVYESESQNINYSKFVGGQTSIYALGFQYFNNDQLLNTPVNSVAENLLITNVNTHDIKIDINNVNAKVDTGFTMVGGQIIPIYDYEYIIDFTITNKGNLPVDKIAIKSQAIGLLNCANTQFQKNYIDVDLKPFKMIELSGSWRTYYNKMKSICLYAISINEEVDTQLLDNSSCYTITSYIEKSLDSPVTVYPNPTENGEVNVKYNHDFTTNQNFDVIVSDITGKTIGKFNHNSSNSSLSIMLPYEGLFYIQIMEDGLNVYGQKVININK